MKRLMAAFFHDRSQLRGLRPWQRHSLVLTVLGLIYFSLGFSFFTVPQDAEREKALQIALQLMPMEGWGITFMAVGGCGVLSARWPRASVTWGYTPFAALSALWATWYVWGVLYGAPLITINGALVWGALAWLWWAISGLVNPDIVLDGEAEHEGQS